MRSGLEDSWSGPGLYAACPWLFPPFFSAVLGMCLLLGQLAAGEAPHVASALQTDRKMSEDKPHMPVETCLFSRRFIRNLNHKLTLILCWPELCPLNRSLGNVFPFLNWTYCSPHNERHLYL